MKLETKIDNDKDDATNFKWCINRMIKRAKEGLTLDEQSNTPLYKLFSDQYDLCGYKDVITITDYEKMVIQELFKQIVENEWEPKDDEEVKEYLTNRRDLVLPILEKGTMEYQMLEDIYKHLFDESVEDIIYLVMTFARVFRWKDLDYHTLECNYKN